MLFLLLCLTMANPDGLDQYWTSWRGPDTTGMAAKSATPPTTWSEDQNIRWKVEVPGFGLATPIIYKDRVYVMSAVPTDTKVEEYTKGEERSWMKPIQPDTVHRFTVMALDRKTGKVVWEKVALEAPPHETTHGDASWASASPLTDGEYLYAYFGSPGLYVYTLDGELKWNTDLGDMRTRNGFGEGASPAVHGDTLVVNWDHEDDSFIVAFDKHTGKEQWRRSRDEPTSWSTPIIVDVDGAPQVIVSATNRVRAYSLADGSDIWEAGGMTMNTIPTPIEQDGVVYVASGFRGNAAMAIKLSGAKGDITNSDHVLWTYDRDTPYVPSMLLFEDHLYFLKRNNGILTVFNAKTGKPAYGPMRLESIKGIYASPVGAAGHVYIVGRAGTTMVLKHGPEYNLVATNKLDERFDASPAVVDGELYLRGHKYLYCIAEN